MANAGWRQFFLSPKGEALKAWRLPVLLRGRRKRRMALLVGLGLVQSLLAVVIALSVRHAFDALNGGEGTSDSGFATAATAIAALACGAILRWREFLESEKLAQSYIHAVRVQVFRHALRLGEAGMAQTSKSAVLLRFTGDMSPLRLWISRGLSRGVVALTSIMVTFVALLIVAPFMGLTIALALALTAVAALALGPALDRSSRKVRRRRTSMLTHAQERLHQMPVIETIGDTTQERRLLARKSDGLARASIRRASLIGVLRSVGEAGAATASLGALLVGVFLTGMALTTPGSVVAAMLLAGLLSPKMQDLTHAFEYWTGARISIEKQQRFLALRPVGRRNGAATSSRRLRTPEGRLELQNIKLSDRPQNVSLRLSHGDRVWLGGMSARDSAMLLRLASGVLHAEKGSRVLLDDIRIGKVHRRDVRRVIALVSADFDLFEASLRANLIYGVSDQAAEGLDALLARHSLAESIAVFPAGLEQVIRSGDKRLTGGLTLLFGLIRARLAGVRIILIDQANVVLTEDELAAIKRVLSDFNGAVLWVGPSQQEGYIAASFERVQTP